VARATRQRLTRRGEVLEAALAVFGQKGYHAASVADIIGRAGIARGTFYLYFENKRAIFEELLDGYLQRIWGAVSRVDLGPGAPTPVSQIHENVIRVLKVLASNRALNRILLRHAVGLDADLDRKLDGFYDRLLERIEGALSLGQGMGVVRAGSTRLLAVCVLGTIKEVTAQYLLGAPGQELEQEGAALEILEYNLHGLLEAEQP
jgi:AcrR family transcriptional regulator